MTAAEVLSAFTRLTGIEFRRPGEEVLRHATEFAEHYSLAELELVIAFTRRCIDRSEGGFTVASLQWHCVMGKRGDGEGFCRFDNRLGLAKEAMKRGWRPPGHAHKPANVINMPQATSDDERERLAKLAMEALKAL